MLLSYLVHGADLTDSFVSVFFISRSVKAKVVYQKTLTPCRSSRAMQNF